MKYLRIPLSKTCVSSTFSSLMWAFSHSKCGSSHFNHNMMVLMEFFGILRIPHMRKCDLIDTVLSFIHFHSRTDRLSLMRAHTHAYTHYKCMFYSVVFINISYTARNCIGMTLT